MAQEVLTAVSSTGVPASEYITDAKSGPKTMTYTELLDSSPMHRTLWLIVLGCMLAQVLDGFDFETTSFALPLILKNFHISAAQAGALSSLTNLGLLVGALIFGPLSDRLGRRVIFQWALSLYALGTFLSAIVPSYHWLLGARFIAGLGIAGEFPVVFALLAEYAPKRQRHIFVGAGAVAYSVGWFICALVSTFLVPKFGWRALYIVGVLPAFMVLYVRRYIPESIRFLLNQGRRKEADEIAQRLAKEVGLSDVQFVAANAPECKPPIARQFSMFRFCAMTALVLGLFQLANNVQVVGIGTWLPSIFIRRGFTLTKSFTFTMFALAATPLGQVFGIYLQDRMPRKWAMLLLAAVSAFCFFGVGFAFEYRYPIAIVVVCNMGYQFFSGGVVPIVYTLSAELFPTGVRSLASGVSVAFSRIGSISGPFILGLLLALGTQIHQIIYYFTLPLVVAAVIVALFLKVDLRGRALEELA